MRVIHTAADLNQWRSDLPPGESVGFVPTMGALHAGHAQLLRHSRRENQHSVLSIFVNPTQFGPNEDLAKYPRTLESDLIIAREMGVDLVFAPLPAEIYPSGYSTFVDENSLSLPLCGRFRPGHFRGVATVVLKLLNLIGPTRAYFGLKDAQQFLVIRKMLQDLNVRIELVGVPTIRESDGLAMSSRNVYLTPGQRALAPTIHRALITLQTLLKSSPVTSEGFSHAIAQEQKHLSDTGFRVQYLEALTLPDLTPVTMQHTPGATPLLIAIAAYLGTTRLIDNLFWLPPPAPLQSHPGSAPTVRLIANS